MSKHENNGQCSHCQEILNKYEGFNQHLRDWFEEVQAAQPETHLSCAGRGRIEQESDFHRGASRAHYGQSSHNFNCAIDLFCLVPGLDLYDRAWFASVIAPRITSQLEWYGKPDAPFKELPHVEIKLWKELVQEGLAKLVE